ncbi:hypothetical protein CGLO_17202 [Colletotrichum gloeosporioides Cg-14]|uniref:Uncharacterized protein n=1 Tax=Colletotrichum gloeosporioides (strain Cg-14) TaxID=1237896 RepID=T0JX87_COLGC|nr:hypothetical protein CGLO_17202 [Colletotrichum gloeosporioides Cg-14]
MADLAWAKMDHHPTTVACVSAIPMRAMATTVGDSHAAKRLKTAPLSRPILNAAAIFQAGVANSWRKRNQLVDPHPMRLAAVI